MTAEPEHYLLHYARVGSAIWIAHLDLMRTFERALMRARLPVVWSGGYNPRPDLQFALPIGVGIEARLEPVGIGLETPEEAIGRRLNEVLPAGLSVVRSEPLAPDKRSLMARVYAADYEFHLNGSGRLLAVLQDTAPLTVLKQGRRGAREIDLRPGIRSFKMMGDTGLRVSVDAGSENNVRPDLLLSALTAAAGGELDWRDARIVRNAVYLA